MKRCGGGWLIMLAMPLMLSVEAQDRPAGGERGDGGGGRRGEGRMPTPFFRTDVPPRPFDLLLGRPTDRTMTVSILAHGEGEGYLSYWPQKGGPVRETSRRALAPGQPVEVILADLEPGERVGYRFHFRPAGATDWSATEERSFTTACPRGRSFTFTVQADPHLDFGSDPPTYVKSLEHVLAAKADFHIDLGDTFMTDKYLRPTDARPQYLAQRYYFGLAGAAVPLFLVLGNHDGEQPARGGSGEESMSVWSARTRTTFFPNPVPDAFYRGNATPQPFVGLLQNYYAWEWGDALFVALDPFWYSGRGQRGDNWTRTLGRAQYDWLRSTLESSTARFKFIFIHHLVGGATPEGRGGAEASAYFEWGGRDLDGSDDFAARRPGWPSPIHDLLVRNRVTIVFHGHDHFYAHQRRDGVVYQLVPQPGHSRFDSIRSASEYGYKDGVFQGSSGILRVEVAPSMTQVEYVRSYPDRAESAAHTSGTVTHRYSVAAPKN